MSGNANIAALLDAVITDPTLRKDLDRAPIETLARHGIEVDASQLIRSENAAMVAPPYVPVGPSTSDMVVPPYVPVSPSASDMVVPPYVPVSPSRVE